MGGILFAAACGDSGQEWPDTFFGIKLPGQETDSWRQSGPFLGFRLDTVKEWETGGELRWLRLQSSAKGDCSRMAIDRSIDCLIDEGTGRGLLFAVAFGVGFEELVLDVAGDEFVACEAHRE